MAAAPGGLDEVELSSLKVIRDSEVTFNAKNKLVVTYVFEYYDTALC